MYTSIPLVIDKGRGIRKEADVKSSIASFLDLLVSSPRGACSADPDFGFVCAIVTVAEIAHRNERIAFFILDFYFLLMLL